MPEIDPITGLPKELGAWDNIAKENQKITIKIIKKKFGKKYTTISGINKHEVDLKDIAKKLKSKFACGGTAKDGLVELQGDHMKDMRKELINIGFSPDQIER
ncbi:stress response translation initiation inhibitor YciH [Candidatus Woesearchaeota archaeon]|nr:stress response translation initiation inhibitor YciH [Candidatus Woesearchaeota archaeon]MCF7901670.1 stress response translation initiation inhibitor YciH [Candidatus Woesearchaeota archaeon]MCF8013344.1 stress response translation initiation inhibitor YciH [Candidatus Woesearchaeota archaeon]